jgi:hypothetical protein
MREDEMNNKMKKKEDRLKRINKYHEKKREKEGVQKKFLEEIERNMQIAESVKAGNYNYASSVMGGVSQ